MEDIISLKDVFYIVGGIVTITGSYLSVKYQGIINSKDIKTVKASNDEQWRKIDNCIEEIASIRERIIQAISMETAEKKFVTKELFDLTIKQFEVDLGQTKNIAQSTLDAVQTLTSNMNSRGTHE